MQKLFGSFIFLLPLVISAQGINNRGKLYIGSGCFVTLTGTQASFNNSSAGSVNNEGIIKLQGNWNNDGQNTVFTNLNSSGEVIFNGQSPQVIGGAAGTDFEKITISNSAGVRLQQSAFVNNLLLLSAGSLYLQSNTLFIRNNNAAAVSRIAGCIVSEQINNSGKIKWNIGQAAGNYIFPMGTSSGIYIPFTLRLMGGNAGNVTVAAYPTSFTNLPYPYTPVLVTNVNDPNGVNNSAYTVDRFWEIDTDGENASATMTFTATPAEVGAITPLFAKRWNAGTAKWDLPLPGQTNTAVSATVPNVSLLPHSPWILSGKGSTLPVELTEFNLITNNKKVIVEWSTLSEINAEYFTVEKSAVTELFEALTTIRANGNSNKLCKYIFTDDQPSNGISFYRLKITDMDGASECYPPKQIKVTAEEGIAIRYDGISGNLSVESPGGDGSSIRLAIAEINGKEVYEANFQPCLPGNKFNMSLHDMLNAGIYIVKASSRNSASSKKIVIR